MTIATGVGFRLSSQQDRVWSQRTTANQMQWLASCEVLVDGNVDGLRLRDAVAEVVADHEILRTVFRRQPGVKHPFQVIQSENEFHWHSPDLNGLDEPTQMARIRELLARVSDPEEGPPLNAVLAALAPGRSILAFGLPVMCADNISLANLVKQVARRYESGPVDAEVLQYADIAEWQQELLTSSETRSGPDYWREYCRKIDFSQPPVLAAFRSKAQGSFERARVAPGLPLASGDVTREFVLACWEVFLVRTLAHTTLVIGCEPGSRKYEDLQDAIGPLTTCLPLQFTPDLESPFADLVEKTKTALDEAEKWQESFAWIQLDDGAGNTPALALAFEYGDLPPAFRAGVVQFTVVRLDSCCEQFELKLVARRSADAFSCELHYDASKLDVATVEDWSRQFATLLTAAAANPGVPAWQLPLLDVEARRRVLVDWNQTAAEYPRESTIHELFEQQAARTPDRTAVCCQESTLSYRELNERANQLAHALRKAGAGPNSTVGLCVDRGIGMIAGILGILKSGAAYVPLSADHPKPRLAAQLEGAVALVAERKFLSQLPELTGPTICLDDNLSGAPGANPERTSGPEDLAYVIYTSGSTGVPKGVAVRHRNLVNYSWFITRRLGLENHPGGLAFATVSTLSADLGNTCIYPSLIGGGCLRVIPYDVSADSQRMCESNARHPVDVLKIVPSHLAALLDSGGGKAVLPRKFLILGGEAFSTRLLHQIQALAPDCQILNHYGPTESTVGSLTLALSEYRPGSGADTVPIGRPIANTQVYILDAHREPVPPGVVGELYIAGKGVTAGYLNRPELTAERFLRDSFSGEGNMYRTGDLARYLPDGNVEFLGRADHQVKIRGFRIELEEIDAAFCSHCAVSQAITVVRPDERGDARLVSYVTPSRDQAPAADALREHLKLQLPDYMIPAAIVILPKLPLNANGKIDRQNLPEPEAAAGKAASYAAPRTPTEQLLAGIWMEVLRRDRIGVDDNFFEIGGHSLLATQVISRVRRSLEIDPPLRLLFESPTVAKVAAWIDEARRKGRGLLMPAITRVGRDQPLPLSFAQQRLWVIDQMDPDNPIYNVTRALRIKGRLDEDALKRSLDEILRRHESQRTTFGVLDGTPVQIVADSMTIALKICNLMDLPAEELEPAAREMARQEALTPFDLAKGPLIRAQLLRLAPEDHVFLLTAHHIISDAWSAGIFLRELGTLYEAFSQGRPSPLPDLTIQYADYAAWQREWLQGETLKRQIEYWREQLSGAPPVLELPSDRPRANAGSHEGALETVWFSPELSQEIRAFSRKEDVTLFMTLVAAYQILLARYSGREQIVVGTDVANRTTLEAESLIGFFINLLPISTNLSGNPTFRELLQRVRTVALGAYAHQDMPFDKLVEELNPDRRANHNPLIQVLFVMQNTPPQVRELAGLKVDGFDVPLVRSKFDLALFMAEKEDRLGGFWVYRSDLFAAETVRRWARHFETLLRSAIGQPDARLSALEMLSEQEKLQRDSEKQERKQLQHNRLMSAKPKAVDLSDGER